MNENVHFVNTNEYNNEEFRIYDIAYLSNNIILSSDIIGQLIYYDIQNENNFNIIKKEVNQIYPIDDLDNLISIYSIDTFDEEDIILGSSKGEVVYLKNNKIEERYINLKSDKFSKVKYISENIFAAGDFKGNITLFDRRQKSYIKILKEQTEEITDILFDQNKSNFLLASSIDSTLCVYDLNKLSLYALSDKLDEELNCLMSYKNGNYILCGSGEGNVLIFNWDWFGDFKDMIKGHPEGINDMDKYNDNIFFTGAEDGLIRICTMFPKGIRGILKNNNKNKKKGQSIMKDVNKIKISNDKKNLITCLGIDCLRLYDISNIEFNKIYKPIDEFEDKDNSGNDEDKSKEIKNKENKEVDGRNKEKASKDFNKEEKEEEEEEDDEEEENDEEQEEEEEDDDDDDDDDDEQLEEKDNDDEEEEEKEISKEEKEKNKFENDNSEELKEIKLLNKKRKKEDSNSKSEESLESEENNKKKEESERNSDSDSDSDSSSTKKKHKKKVKKIGKKTKSLIAKEERKAFFNDL